MSGYCVRIISGKRSRIGAADGNPFSSESEFVFGKLLERREIRQRVIDREVLEILRSERIEGLTFSVVAMLKSDGVSSQLLSIFECGSAQFEFAASGLAANVKKHRSVRVLCVSRIHPIALLECARIFGLV